MKELIEDTNNDLSKIDFALYRRIFELTEGLKRPTIDTIKLNFYILTSITLLRIILFFVRVTKQVI